MRVREMVRADPTRIGRLWRATSRRRRIVIGLFGLVAIFAGWMIYDQYFSWSARLALKSEAGNYPVAFSPDGTRLVTSMPDGFVLWDTKDGRRLADWPNMIGIRGTSGKFSPDGKTFVAFWSLKDAKDTPSFGLIDVATGRIRISFARPLPNVFGTAFMNEGRTLRVFARDQTSRSIVDIDLATGQAVPLSVSCPAATSWQYMSDDGRILAVVDTRAVTIPVGTRSVILWDLDHDRQVGLISASRPVGSINNMCLTPDGKTLVMSLSDRSIEVWDIPTATLRTRFSIHSPDFRPWMLRFSPDGSKVASYGQWVQPAVSMHTVRFLMQRLANNPNPQVYELVVHDLATGRRLGRTDREGLVSVFSEDGRTLATSHDDGATRLHDLPASR